MTELVPKIAVSLALRHSRDGRFLLVKRGRAPSKGLWAFAGGRVEFGETLAEAAKRELAEETGLIAQGVSLFDVVEIIHRSADEKLPSHHYVLHVYVGHGVGEPKAMDDAEDARWVTLEEMSDMPVTQSTADMALHIVEADKLKKS